MIKNSSWKTRRCNKHPYLIRPKPPALTAYHLETWLYRVREEQITVLHTPHEWWCCGKDRWRCSWPSALQLLTPDETPPEFAVLENYQLGIWERDEENMPEPSAPIKCLPVLQPLQKHAELPLVPEDTYGTYRRRPAAMFNLQHLPKKSVLSTFSLVNTSGPDFISRYITAVLITRVHISLGFWMSRWLLS